MPAVLPILSRSYFAFAQVFGNLGKSAAAHSDGFAASRHCDRAINALIQSRPEQLASVIPYCASDLAFLRCFPMPFSDDFEPAEFVIVLSQLYNGPIKIVVERPRAYRSLLAGGAVRDRARLHARRRSILSTNHRPRQLPRHPGQAP